MSLMNDALRKKNQETTGSPAAPGFSDVSRRSYASGRKVAVTAALILLAAAILAGVYLMRSASGNTLLAKNHQATHSRPPANHVNVQAPAVLHPAEASPQNAPAPHERQSIRSGEAPQENRLTAALPEPVPSPAAEAGDAPGTRSSEPSSLREPARSEPAASDEITVSPSFEPSADPLPHVPQVVSGTVEPGPVQTGRHEATVSATPPNPRTTTRPAAAPAPPGVTENVGERTTGDAVRSTAPSVGQADLFYQKARACHRSGRLADAIRFYRQVLKSDSNHTGAMLNLAAATMQQGNYFDAQMLLHRLAQSTPRPRGVLLNLAIAAIGTGCPEKAVDYLDKAAAALDASPWEIHFHRAVAFTHMNRLPEALALYRKAEAEQPDDPRLQFNLAVTCDALGLYPEALAHYEAAVRLPSESPEIDKETILQRMRTIGRFLDSVRSAAKGQ